MSEPNLPENLSDVRDWLEKKEVKAQENPFIELTHKESINLRSKIKNHIRSEEKRGETYRNKLQDLTTVKNSLDEQIKELNITLQEKEQVIKNKDDSISKTIEGIVHSSINPRITYSIIENVKQELSKKQVDDFHEKVPQTQTTRSEISANGSIISFGDSLLPGLPSEVRSQRSMNRNYDTILGWNKFSTSADSCRVYFYPYGLSLTLCDGTSQGARSSEIISKIYSILLTEKFPLTEGFSNFFGSRNTLSGNIIKSCIQFSSNGGKFSTNLSGQIPFEEWKEEYKQIGNGSTTIINSIILDNGMVWSTAIGDSALYHYTANDGHISQIFPKENNEGDGTDSLGLESFKKPAVPDVRFLNNGDMIFATSDLLSQSEYMELRHLIPLLHELRPNMSQQLNTEWGKIVSKTDQSDDVSLFSVKYIGPGFDVQARNVSESGDRYTIDKTEFEKYAGDYYKPSLPNLFQQTEKGAKKISNHVAAILSQFKESNSMDWPQFLPQYEIFKGAGNNGSYFVEMEHYGNLEYQRLDKAISESKSESQFEDLLQLLNELEKEMDERMVFHGDICPTNIFIDREGTRAYVIDLNSLMWPGSPPPPTLERGHPGMYGSRREKSNVPSSRVHKLPFRVLELTLYLFSTVKEWGTGVDGRHNDVTSNEEYILLAEQIYECYSDDSKHAERVDALCDSYPYAERKKIETMVEALHFTKVYSLS
jgi:hypothetical protein